ncbi:hypothetical protein BC940DRAFT_334527 [Gongronella butleri]|nr:hypothetical protein BC940DRAFT_334527 [Gongronella butleri]
MLFEEARDLLEDHMTMLRGDDDDEHKDEEEDEDDVAEAHRLLLLADEDYAEVYNDAKARLETAYMHNREHKERFLEGVRTVVAYNRQLVIHAMMFVQFYIVSRLSNNQHVPRALFDASFFSGVFQLLLGKKWTNKSKYTRSEPPSSPSSTFSRNNTQASFSYLAARLARALEQEGFNDIKPHVTRGYGAFVYQRSVRDQDDHVSNERIRVGAICGAAQAQQQRIDPPVLEELPVACPEYAGFHCDVDGCDKIFTTRSLLEEHKVVKHKIVDKVNPCQFSYCNRTSPHDKSLIKHIIRVYNRPDHQNFFNHRFDMRIHYAQWHMKLIVCRKPHCNVASATQAAHERHLEDHKTNEPPVDDIISKIKQNTEASRDVAIILRHYMKLHSLYYYICKKCPLVFSSKEAVEKHMKKDYSV